MSPKLVLGLRGWHVYLVQQVAVLALFLGPFLVWRTAESNRIAIPVTFALFELVVFGWMLAIGAAMNKRVPRSFQKGFVLPSLGLAAAFSFPAWGSAVALVDSESLIVGLYSLVAVINVFVQWLCCRSLVAAEAAGKPPLGRVLGAFFALWLSMAVPIAAWHVQNRARRVYGLAT